MAIPVRKNFCLAPFTQLTYSPLGHYSPCPEIGGRPWKNTDLKSVWNSEDFTKLRNSFAENKKSSVCNRCWDQEDNGMQSLRKRLFVSPNLKKDIVRFLDKDYELGPRQINLMVGNLCNLRCRICRAESSVTFNPEGKYYEEKYNLSKTLYVTENKKPNFFSTEQIEDIFNLSANLIRLEFYGGEPLMDTPTLTLLEKLINAGRSKNITLFYNTNAVTEPTPRHFELWSQFDKIEFNFSLDNIDSRFTYERHPAKWSDAVANIDKLKNYNWTIPADFFAICTISIFNVYYLPEIIKQLDAMELPIFLNTVHSPDYYDIRYFPPEIKKQILERLNQFPELDSKIKFVKNMLAAEVDNNQWEEFKFWTKEKDNYRKENFSDTYPELYTIFKSYDNTL